jgi:anti-sigma regulatory factor (Ser/Thr protein kinase)
VVKQTLNLKLAPVAEAISVARRSLDDLEGAVPPETLEDVRLMVSELVTNSVRHAGLGDDDEIELRVRVTREMVYAEVCDPGPGPKAPPRAPRPHQYSGWGLYIVEQLADRWGVERKALACVWFEVDLDRAGGV